MEDKYKNNDIIPDGWYGGNDSESDSQIKVIGVGGGGVNAVSYMYEHDIKGCQFFVCNTDSQTLRASKVKDQIQLGPGLGAGTDPKRARDYAIESADVISEKVLTPGTIMLFITAGMGGGTGTGASPVIAKMAKEKSILTVGVVTLPFKNEGQMTLSKASDGVRELQNYVDSLLVINNEKLYDYFGDLKVFEAFPKTDEVLATAVKGIVDIIKKRGHENVDMMDVRTMMKDSGMALMGHGTGSGKNRLNDAVKEALESPLFNDFDLTTSKNLLLNITMGRNAESLSMLELQTLEQMIAEKTGNVLKYKRGIIWEDDPDYGDKVSITAIATGFKMDMTTLIGKADLGKIIEIDSDFEYKPESVPFGKEVELSDKPLDFKRIGSSTMENQRHFTFADKELPVLLRKPDAKDSELALTTAVRRRKRGGL